MNLPTAYVKAAEGRRVRDPADGQVLPDIGRRVPLDTYWRRKLADADVVETDEPEADPDGVVLDPQAEAETGEEAETAAAPRRGGKRTPAAEQPPAGDDQEAER